jgi:hypothetical protein
MLHVQKKIVKTVSHEISLMRLTPNRMLMNERIPCDQTLKNYF